MSSFFDIAQTFPKPLSELTCLICMWFMVSVTWGGVLGWGPIWSGTCTVPLAWIIGFSSRHSCGYKNINTAASSFLSCLFLAVSPLNSLILVIWFLLTKPSILPCSNTIVFFYDQYCPTYICKYFLPAYYLSFNFVVSFIVDI